MQVIFLGTNVWYDSPTGNTICTLINSDKYHIILDSGNGLYKAGRYYKIRKVSYISRNLMINRIRCGLLEDCMRNK